MQTKKPENPKISWLTVIFLGGLAPFSVKNHWKFTIKDGKLVALMYRLTNADGTTQDEICPNCYGIED